MPCYPNRKKFAIRVFRLEGSGGNGLPVAANAPQWLFEFSNDPGIGDEVKMNLQHMLGHLKVSTSIENAVINSDSLCQW